MAAIQLRCRWNSQTLRINQVSLSTKPTPETAENQANLFVENRSWIRPINQCDFMRVLT